MIMKCGILEILGHVSAQITDLTCRCFLINLDMFTDPVRLLCLITKFDTMCLIVGIDKLTSTVGPERDREQWSKANDGRGISQNRRTMVNIVAKFPLKTEFS